MKRLLCLALTIAAIIATVKADTVPIWSAAPSMAVARYGAAGGVAAGKLIVTLGSAESFDPSQGWTSIASPPVAVAYAAGAGIGNKLYLAGGCTGGDCTGSSNSNALQIFDAITGTWTQGAPMPTARHLLSLAAIAGKLYAVGGYVGAFRPVSTLECYDPTSNSWSTLTPMAFARASAFSGAIDGKLYVAGGFSNPGVQDKVEAYDPATDRWTTKAPMPAGQQNGGSAVVDGRLIAIGGTGTSGSAPAPHIAIYNAALDTWSTGPAVPTARYGLIAGVINGRAYAAGGANFASVPLNVVEALTMPGNTIMALDTPANGSTSGSRLQVSGWAIDRDAPTGTGVDAVHVYAFLNAGGAFGPGTFLGSATLGGTRPDVAEAFGSQFLNSGFSLLAPALTPGTYRISAYSRSTVSGAFVHVRSADVTVTQSTGNPAMALDTPAAGATVVSPFAVHGWAIDRDETIGAGVNAVHIYASPITNGTVGAAVFLGAATLGVTRTDVANAFGSQFVASGFTLAAATLTPGSYRITAYARSTVTGTFSQQRIRDITVTPPVGNPAMALDAPTNGASVSAGFAVSGWAIDRNAGAGAGVDLVHVWGIRVTDQATTFLGAATLGSARPDVGTAFGAQFTNSGYALVTPALAAGTYDIGVYARSSVTGTFNQQRIARVTVAATTDVSGSWNGASPDGLTVNANSIFCDTTDDVLLQLTQAGTAFTGSVSFTRRGVRSGCSGPILGGNTMPVFSGIVSGSSVTFGMGLQGTALSFTFTGTLANNQLSGTVKFSDNSTVGTLVVTKVVTDDPCASSPCTLSVPATYTFIVPSNVTSLSVQTWGAGGGAGGGCSTGSSSTGGAAGGGGGYATRTVSVTPGQIFSVTVGAGGGGGSTPSDGGASSFGTVMTANGGGKGGGSGGGSCPNSSPGGAGGFATGGETNLTGANGTAGTANGPGGTGGTAAGPGGGAGGSGGAAGSGNGSNGQAPGGGAGGDGGGGTQGAAAPGRVVISWQ